MGLVPFSLNKDLRGPSKESIVVYKSLRRGNKAFYGETKYKRFRKMPHIELKPRMIFNMKEHIPEYINGYHSWMLNDIKIINSVFIIPKEATIVAGYQDGDAPGYVSSTIIYCGRIYDPITWIFVVIYKLFC